MNSRNFILCLLALLPVSCSPDSGDVAPPPTQTLSQRLGESNGYKQDAEGNWLPKSDKRSSFENQGKSAYFHGDYGTKAYQTTGYAKKSWWGNKNYNSRPYAGNTDGSRFQKSSGMEGKMTREAGQSAGLSKPYQTNAYATNPAREAGNERIEKTSDTETDIRREVYQQPEIIDWRQQRSLSLEQSKGILGR